MVRADPVFSVIAVNKGNVDPVKAVSQREIETDFCLCTDFFANPFLDEFRRRFSIDLQDVVAHDLCDLVGPAHHLHPCGKTGKALQGIPA